MTSEKNIVINYLKLMVMKNVKKEKFKGFTYLFLLMLFSRLTASAQQGITVKGTVVDATMAQTIIGASVVVKGK